MKKYIKVPLVTSLNEIINKDYTLSATQYKSFHIKNKNIKPLSTFLDRQLERKDLGTEVGSECYVENSPFLFIKTKALQPGTYLPEVNKESFQHITPQNYVDMDLKKGDLLISKDSNVGEIVILDKDYPNAMLCGAIYRLPITEIKYYLLAFIKSDVFRQQIDFLVPRGSTIRHGKTKFLDCLIPLPNKNPNNTIRYVELLTQAIINKEIEIKNKHNKIINEIQNELERNQNTKKFKYDLPSISEIINLDRMDSSLYSEEFKRNEFLITNYKYGYKTLTEKGYRGIRGTSLENNFGGEGYGKGKSFVVIENENNIATNYHGIRIVCTSETTINSKIFVKCMLTYLREKGLIDCYGVGGNGGHFAPSYFHLAKIPNFPVEKEIKIVKLYHNSDSNYKTDGLKFENFLNYDNKFNQEAGIYELDKSMKYLQSKLDDAINAIVDNVEVDIKF